MRNFDFVVESPHKDLDETTASSTRPHVCVVPATKLAHRKREIRACVDLLHKVTLYEQMPQQPFSIKRRKTHPHSLQDTLLPPRSCPTRIDSLPEKPRAENGCLISPAAPAAPHSCWRRTGESSQSRTSWRRRGMRWIFLPLMPPQSKMISALTKRFPN